MSSSLHLDSKRYALPLGLNAQFSYATAAPLTRQEEPKSRHAYARDAFCTAIRATRDVFGGTALRFSGMPLEQLQDATLAEVRLKRAHRVGAAVGWGAGCLLGALMGAATWLNPVDAAHDRAVRGAIVTARAQASADLLEVEASWSEDITCCGSLPQVQRLLACAKEYVQALREGDTELGRAALGSVLVDRALAHLKTQDPAPPAEVRRALRRAQDDFTEQAREAAVVHCKDTRTGALYHNDSPTLLRLKCALLALSAPVVASVNVLVTMAFGGGRAVHAACAMRDLREALNQSLRVAQAPLLGVGLQLAALGGVLAPNLGRKLYARLEAPMAWQMAPCFQPFDHESLGPSLARPGMAPRPEAAHGLGGIPVGGGGRI